MNLADRLYRALESALAHRDSAAQLLLAQVPFLAEPAAVALVRALVAQRPDLSLNASALSQWCAPAREAAIAHVLSKPRGRNRIESMLALEALLPREHHVEALEGILDGTARVHNVNARRGASRRITSRFVFPPTGAGAPSRRGSDTSSPLSGLEAHREVPTPRRCDAETHLTTRRRHGPSFGGFQRFGGSLNLNVHFHFGFAT